MNIDKRIIAIICIITVVVGVSVYLIHVKKIRLGKSKPINKTTVKKTTKPVNKTPIYSKDYQDCIKYFGKSIEKEVPYEWFEKGVKLYKFISNLYNNKNAYIVFINGTLNKLNYTLELTSYTYIYSNSHLIANTMSIMPSTGYFFEKIKLTGVSGNRTASKVIYIMSNNTSGAYVCIEMVYPLIGPSKCLKVNNISNFNLYKQKLLNELIFGYLLKNKLVRFVNNSTTNEIILTFRNINISNETNVLGEYQSTMYILYNKTGLEKIYIKINNFNLTMEIKPVNVTKEYIENMINQTITSFKNSNTPFITVNNITELKNELSNI